MYLIYSPSINVSILCKTKEELINSFQMIEDAIIYLVSNKPLHNMQEVFNYENNL